MTTQISGNTGVSQVQDGVIVAADFDPSLFAASLLGNGYQKLPSGLIIQWGAPVPTPNASGDFSVSFPISFPNAVLSVQLTNANQAAAPNISFGIYLNPTLAAFDGRVWNAADGSARTTQFQVYFLAIGY